MKKIYIGLIAIVCVVSIFLFSRKSSEVQVVKARDNNDSVREFLSDLAYMNNQKGINIKIDGESYTAKDLNGFVSDSMKMMLPLDTITDVLDCSVNQYNDGLIQIEKGESIVEMRIGNDVANVSSGETVRLGSKVVELDDTVYVPVNDIASFINYSFIYKMADASLNMKKIKEEETLPSSYDMRANHRVTPVRDQGRYGTCWAFASLAALETSLMPKEEMIFSPDHMSLCNGFNLKQNQGGEYTMAIAYLASWKGPVLEKDDPYGDDETNENLTAVKHLEEAIIISEKDYEGIKDAVYKYGAVQTSIYTQLKDAGSWSKYYNRDRATYYFNGKAVSNHDILIVGWDDNFPKEYFSNEPEGDGAFICKNSWGESFGEDGYFYVSYYDNNIGVNNVVYSKLGGKDNFDKIYQSDLLGWTGHIGYNKSFMYFANVYKAGRGEQLDAVSFYATGPDTTYKVYVVPEFEGMESLSMREPVAEGAFANAGYYTVRLDSSVPLPDDGKFAVIVYIDTKDAVHPVAIEYDADDRTDSFDIGDGEGYISLYGEVWTSAEETQNCNLCLKAFTSYR